MDKQIRDVLDHMLRGFVSWIGPDPASVARGHFDEARSLLDAAEQPKQPQPAGEFPRVWVEFFTRQDGTRELYDVHSHEVLDSEQYVHISELEAANAELVRLREVANRAVEAIVAAGDECPEVGALIKTLGGD